MIGRMVTGAIYGLGAWTLISFVLCLVWGIARAGQKRRDHTDQLAEWDAHVAAAVQLTVPPASDQAHPYPLPAIPPHTAALIARMSAARIDHEWAHMNRDGQ